MKSSSSSSARLGRKTKGLMEASCKMNAVTFVRVIMYNSFKFRPENMAAFKGKVGFAINGAGSIVGWRQVQRTPHVFLVGAVWAFRGSRSRARSPASSPTRRAGSGSSAAAASSGSCGGTASWSSEESTSTSPRRR